MMSYTYYQKTCVEMGHHGKSRPRPAQALDSPGSIGRFQSGSFHRMYCGFQLNAAVVRKKRVLSNFIAGSAACFGRYCTKQCCRTALLLLAGCESFAQDLCRLSQRILFQNEKAVFFPIAASRLTQIRESGEDFSPAKGKTGSPLILGTQATNTLLTKRAGPAGR
ncbi:MAG: hypothetical protein ACLSG9_06655 [Eubacterium sp.]